jgi:hypothetical protein
MHLEFNKYIKEWDNSYQSTVQSLDIFSDNYVNNWTMKQKKEFVRVFYHARGHFINFLWFLGNFTDNADIKNIVISNITEELNGTAKSHEMMYVDFANELNVDLKEDILGNSDYPLFIKEFNKAHIEFLYNNTQSHRVAALAAYERLDNIDYKNLYSLAKNITGSKKGLLFFLIHTRVEHYKPLENHLKNIWETSPDSIREGFSFIAHNQIGLWKNLSEYINSI